MPHAALKGCHITPMGTWKDWSGQKIKDWVDHAGGKTSTAPNDNTTHAVITEQVWSTKPAFLLDILARKEAGQEIHIVDFQWLEDSLMGRSKRAEYKHCYERRERELAKAAEKEKEEMEKLEKKAMAEPKSVTGMLTAEFLGHTEQYVDEKERKRVLEKARAEEMAKKEREEEKRKEFERQRAEGRILAVSEVFKRGVKKSRNDLLSDNHHIYTDSTGFSYEVILSKVNPYNKNQHEVQELTLQIFESHTEPQTYAFNARFTSTILPGQNNIIAAIGSPFPIAFRAFKKVFKEHTRVAWDDRFAAAEQRKEKEGEKFPKKERMVEFKDLPFLYHPPAYGPVGVIPGQTLAEAAAATIQRRREYLAAVGHGQGRYTMSGGNGKGKGPLQVTKNRDSESDDDHEPLEDLDRIEEEVNALGDGTLANAFDYPFPAGEDVDGATGCDEDVDMDAAAGYDEEELADSVLGKRKEIPEDVPDDDDEEEGSPEKKGKIGSEHYPFDSTTEQPNDIL